MDQRTIVIFAHSVTLVDEMTFELSRLLPGLRVRAAAGSPGVLPELDRGDIAANVICPRGREEEPWVTELLHSLQDSILRIPTFVFAKEKDAELQLRCLELGVWSCVSRAADLSRQLAELGVLSAPKPCDHAPQPPRSATDAPP